MYIIDFEASSINISDTWIFDLMTFVECASLYTDDIMAEKLEALYDELNIIYSTKSTDADLYKNYIIKFKNILFSGNQ